jgi:hypothetical protein
LLKIQDKWEYREFLGNLGIFWGLTWDFYKITVGHYFPSMPYRFSKVVSFWIVLLIRLGLELGLRLGLGVRVGVGFGLVT